jgi:hypothetical protein
MMKQFAAIALALFYCWPWLPAQEPVAVANDDSSRFLVVDVQVNSGAEPLAAYQLEVSSTNGAVKIVGIEGGEHPAFRQPPYYDPAAMQQDHVILGAFNTAAAGQLPSGTVRVASIHVMAVGNVNPSFSARVETAATLDGRPIPVQISIKERNGK